MNNSKNNKSLLDNPWFSFPMMAAFVIIYLIKNTLYGGGFFISIFYGVIVGFVFAFLHWLFTAPAKRAEAGRQLNIAFYKKCVDNGIYALDSEKNRLRAELIAKDLNCGYIHDIQSYFEHGRKLGQEADKETQRQQLSQRLEKLAEEEKTEYDQLTEYAGCVGNEKTIRILTRQLDELRKQHNALKNFSSNAASLLMEKEQNWAVAGGIASGIAGGAAGVATALDIQAKNADTRARNAQNAALIVNAQTELYKSGAVSKAAANLTAAEKTLSKEKLKLVAKIPGSDLIEYLNISDEEVSVSETGAFRVSASVSMTKPLIIFDDLPARIDGSLVAVVSQNGRTIGEAEMVFPLYGVFHDPSQKKTLKGISLKGASVGVPCTVSFSGKNLYAVEN